MVFDAHKWFLCVREPGSASAVTSIQELVSCGRHHPRNTRALRIRRLTRRTRGDQDPSVAMEATAATHPAEA
eukprot:1240867-Prymnesium_polylepis.1